MIAIAEPARVIDHPSGFLACAAANQRFEQAGRTGFISYRIQGRYWIALGGVHAGPDDCVPLLQAFLALVREQGLRCLFVQVPEHQVAAFESCGATVNRLGSTFAIHLPGHSMKGAARLPLHNKIHRATRAGLHAIELGRERPATAALKEQIAAISAAWLRDKGKKELAFMVGAVSDEDDALRRTFVALSSAGDAVGFITYVPVWGRYGGYLHDLSRQRADAPPGAMELINAFAMERLRDEGVQHLHFGFTPFVPSGTEPRSASPMMARLFGWLYRHGSFVYPARSQENYKRKWGTDLVMPEYIAGFPLSLSAVLALLRLTRAR